MIPNHRSPDDKATDLASPGEAPVNILIVDDEPRNLTVLEAILDEPAYRLVRAVSAQEALHALLHDEFALLILDIRMPEVSGFDLAQMIRERKKTANVPIIFLTAHYGDQEHVIKGYGAGAVDFLSKPVNPTVLRSKVSIFAELYRKRHNLEQVNSALQAEVRSRRHAEKQLRELNNTLERQAELLQRQADLLDQSHDAILAFRMEGSDIVYWNRGAERLYGYTAADAEGRRTHELLQTRAPIPIGDIYAQVVHGESWYGELTHTTRDGRDIVVESRIVPVSYNDDIYALETNRDITARKKAEEALRKSEEQFRSSILHSPVPTMLYDDREQILAVSESWLKAAGGLSAAEIHRMEDWTIRVYGERSGEILGVIREIIATDPQARTDEMVLTVGDDKRIWNFFTSSLGAQPDGRRLFVVLAQDVTDRRAYEERIDLLMREARHRTKNILGLVQAVARQTAAREPEHFIESFTERIQALAVNQDLLVKNRWQGADVEELVRVQLAHFADLLGSRIAVHGRKLRLNAAAAQAVGLAIHELATNAGKYGALSTDGGRVDVDWRSDAGNFAIHWTEREGPPVSPPSRRGFGSTVVESMAKRAVGGEVELDYAPSGLEWQLTCPAANALEANPV